jgi:hypothetical protein
MIMVSYDTMLRTFKAELEQTEKFKKDMIVKLAKQLEKESDIPVSEINDRIASDLEGYLTRQWVGQCLADKYKNDKKQHKEKKDKNKKEKQKLIEVTADGTQLPNFEDEDEQRAKFNQDLGKALEERSSQSANLNDAVVKELDLAINKRKELESKLENVITPDEYKKLEEKLILQDEILDSFRNHIGEFVLYNKDLEIEYVKTKSRDERIKISLRNFEDAIKDSFKHSKSFAYIDHDGSIVTDWK